MFLFSNHPQSNVVEEGKFQYYAFEANCDDCVIVIALSTFGNGNPDLYINFGDEELPNLDNHHIGKSTLRSEVF